MSPAMKRTGCLILPPAFWKMLFVFLAAFLDQEMAQEKRLSTNNRMDMSRWFFSWLRHLFVTKNNPATWIEANCLHVWWLQIAPCHKSENPSGSQFRFKPQLPSSKGTGLRLQLPPKCQKYRYTLDIWIPHIVSGSYLEVFNLDL